MVASSPCQIAVCICTFRRPELLAGLLARLQQQETEGRFSFLVRVVDNDKDCSARPVVEAHGRDGVVPILYLSEPRQNISHARNCAVRGLSEQYVAMIDDDELPIDRWLWLMFNQIQASGVDGVLGPVLPLYPEGCPSWLKRSGLCVRPTYQTGTLLTHGQTRTGNVLLRRSLFDGDDTPFNVKYGQGGGEDVDFFRRQVAQGRRFTWCNEAEAYEWVPPERWQLRYYVRRQYRLGGLLGERKWSLRILVRSLASVTVQGLLAFARIPFGKHAYAKPFARAGYHAGYVTAVCGFRHDRTRDEFSQRHGAGRRRAVLPS